MRIVKNNFKHNITLTKLENLAWINKNNLNKNQNEINYLDISNAKSGEILSLKHIIGKSNFPSRAKRIANAGDSVFSTVRPNLKGYAFIKENNIVVSSGFSVVSAKNKKYEKFLYYYLSSQKSLDWMMSICKGSNYPAFSPNDIKNCHIINIEEKEAYNIGLILSYQEEQIKNIKQLIKKIETRNQYYAEKILSGELRVRKNEDGNIEFYNNTEWQDVILNGNSIKIPLLWKVKKITEIIKTKKGSSIKSELLNYIGNGIQYLRTNEVWDNSSVNKDKTYFDGETASLTVKDKNEYIICFDGFNTKPHIGTVGMVTNNGEGICSGELHKIQEIDGISKYYVNVMMLKNSRFQDLICRSAEGSTVKHAGKHFKNIEEILIPIDEQELLNDIFKNQLHEIDSLKSLLEKEQLRFQWLLDNLLSGEYQVVDE